VLQVDVYNTQIAANDQLRRENNEKGVHNSKLLQRISELETEITQLRLSNERLASVANQPVLPPRATPSDILVSDFTADEHESQEDTISAAMHELFIYDQPEFNWASFIESLPDKSSDIETSKRAFEAYGIGRTDKDFIDRLKAMGLKDTQIIEGRKRAYAIMMDTIQ